MAAGALTPDAPALGVSVTPAVVVPRQTVTALVTGSAGQVRSAKLDWGYTNFFCCPDGESDDWVSVVVADVPIADGELSSGPYDFRIPSWAPPSSTEIARWSCRLTVDRDGRDEQARGDFTVVARPQDAYAGDEPVERYDGAGLTVIDIALPSPVYAAGQAVTGQITLTPATDLPDGELSVRWQSHRESHPLARTPCETAPVDGPNIALGKGIPLRAGKSVTVPFEVVLPDGAAPTAAAVHSSMSWAIAAELRYAGTAERVRKPVVVVNAPS